MNTTTTAEKNPELALMRLEAPGEVTVIGSGASEVPALSIDQIFGNTAVFNDLPVEFRAEALALSAEIDVDENGAKLDPLHQRAKKSSDTFNALGTMLIGDSKVKEVDYVGDVLREVQNAKKEVNLEVIREDPGKIRRFFMSLPFIGNYFNPVFVFMEGWEKVNSKIDGWADRLNQGEVASRLQKKQLREAREGNKDAFRALDVTVAAAEHALLREFQEYREAVLAAKDSRDQMTLINLRDRRSGLENFAFTLQRYQTARGRAIANFPILEGMETRTTTVITDVQTLRETVLPQFRLTVGASIQNLKTRKQMKTNRDLVDLQAEADNQLLVTLGMAEKEEHAMKMQAATEGHRVAQLFDGLTKLAELSAANRAKELQAFATSKATLLTAIETWKKDTKANLEKWVEAGVVPDTTASSSNTPLKA